MNKLPKLEDLTAQTTWNRRYREMSEILHHSPEARELIVKALEVIKLTKDLSYGERKMHHMALHYDTYKAEQDQKVVDLKAYREKLGLM